MRSAETALDRYLPVLDRQLEGKEYVLGRLTVADFQMAPWVETAPILKVDTGRYLGIAAWIKRLQGRPYWKDA